MGWWGRRTGDSVVCPGAVFVDSVWEACFFSRDVKVRFDAAGVELIAVGVGTPDKAQILADRRSPWTACILIPCARLYFGLGLTFFNPASTKVFSRFDAIQKALKNYMINVICTRLA
ncbi:hypothetical protein MLD38_005179 [Melastoma candidum]|uniref:Uncharacterized protein n=1 Tax=Melastoma candidum TaxID=119954 RepID=A0ACB9S821_9MYRT|nr:hypothetical protein MLD38_005179 [Melastoma candidum]